MNYLRWHYMEAPKFILRLIENYLFFVSHLFSVKLLTRTLFSPWRKEVARKTALGISFGEIGSRISFNIISRILGFIIRISTLFTALIFYVVVILLGFSIFLIWLLIPILSLPIYLSKRAKDDSKEKQVFIKSHLQSNLKPKDVENVSSWYDRLKIQEKKRKEFWTKENLLSIPGIGRNWAFGYTPLLENLTVDLSKESFSLERFVGRKNQIDQLERALTKEENNNIFLVGQPGVGRKTIAIGLAKLIDSGKCLDALLFKRVLLLDLQRITSTNQAETEQKLADILEEARQAENIILVIPNIEEFIKDSHINLTEVLSEHLQGKNLQLIGITDPTSYQKYVLPNPSLLKIFEKVDVEEISKDEALEILENYASILEKKYKITITYEALFEIIKQSDELITEIPFPEKSIELLEESLVFAKEKKETILSAEDIDEILSQKTNIPLGQLSIKDKDKLLDLENTLHKRVIGQDLAISKISRSLRRKRAGVNPEKSPIGTFLFVGPTGVGKTETAKALAQIYFGSEDKITRLDMSEFQNEKDIGKLIGDNENTGILTSSIRQNPFTVLLLDEFEKANSKIQNIFLTVFDEGYITDGLGKKVNFKNTIIIATSNAGSEFIREKINAGILPEDFEKDLINYLLSQKIFSPELINRFSAVVFYKPLNKTEFEAVAKIMIDKLNNKLKEEKEITISLSENSMTKLIDKGYDEVFGARNLERVIQENIEDKIAEKILKEDIKKGSEIEINI